MRCGLTLKYENLFRNRGTFWETENIFGKHYPGEKNHKLTLYISFSLFSLVSLVSKMAMIAKLYFQISLVSCISVNFWVSDHGLGKTEISLRDTRFFLYEEIRILYAILMQFNGFRTAWRYSEDYENWKLNRKVSFLLHRLLPWLRFEPGTSAMVS